MEENKYANWVGIKEQTTNFLFIGKFLQKTYLFWQSFLGNLVGVAELCNKIGKPSFTKHDEQIASTFAVYCAISISHVRPFPHHHQVPFSVFCIGSYKRLTGDRTWQPNCSSRAQPYRSVFALLFIYSLSDCP